MLCCMAVQTNWSVSVDNGTVVVELPATLSLDRETGEQINEAFFEAVTKPTTDSVLTLLRVEDPLDSGTFEEVKRGADRAAANDINRWAIVVERKIKGMAFGNSIDGLETAVFEDEQAAREWLGGV